MRSARSRAASSAAAFSAASKPPLVGARPRDRLLDGGEGLPSGDHRAHHSRIAPPSTGMQLVDVELAAALLAEAVALDDAVVVLVAADLLEHRPR